MKIFDAGDVIRFAVRVEEDGEYFYRQAALAAEDKGIRDVFNYLADEETKHKALFQNMLSEAQPVDRAETYDNEYGAYLRDYIDDKVIFAKKVKEDVAVYAKDPLSAITYAMQREADSILYYHEAKQFIAGKYYTVIDKIIAEERKHFSRLSELRQKNV